MGNMGNATSLCAACGVEFIPTAHRRGRPDARFCSATCRALWERTRGTRLVTGPPTAEPTVAAGAVEVGADAGRTAPLPPLGTEHSCPHCGHRLTIVNFVLPSLDSAGDVDAADDEDLRNRYSAG